MNNWILTLYNKPNAANSRMVFENRTEGEATSEAMSYIEAKHITSDWTLQPFKILSLEYLGFPWFVRVTPTTFELLDADTMNQAFTADVYFGAESCEHNIEDVLNLENQELYQTTEWIDWYNFEVQPAMSDYGHDKLN